MIDLKDAILYEDADILAINKPAGLVVHSDGRTEEETLADWFVSKYPEAAGVGEPIIKTSPNPLLGLGEGRIERPGIVHRIDRDTSGVLLLAKTARGHEFLKAQFQNRAVEKTYHLFVYGDLKDDHGTLSMPIGRSAGDFRKWSARPGSTRGENREAVTYYQVLKRSPEQGVTFVEAKPKTGRTHQIRVHFQALQRPVVSDPLYAPGKPKLLGFERTALHARKVAFTNLEGKRVELTAPYPADFQAALDLVASGVLD